MKKRKWSRTIASLVCLLMCHVSVVEAQAGGSAPDGVRIALVTEDRTAIGIPVFLKLKIENGSQQAYAFFAPATRRFGYDTVIFHVSPPGQEAFFRVASPGIYDGPMKAGSPPKYLPSVTVPPGGSSSFGFVLDYDCPTIRKRKWLFPVVGEYEIRASVFLLRRAPKTNGRAVPRAPRTTVETPPVSVRIVEPEPGERAAYAAMRRLTYDYLLYAPECYHPDKHVGALDETRRFIARHSRSSYARYGELLVWCAAFAEGENRRDARVMQDALNSCRGLEVDKSPSLRFKARELCAIMTRRMGHVRGQSSVKPLSEPRLESQAGAGTKAQPATAEEKAAIEGLIKRYAEAFVAGNVTGCLSLLTDDFLYMNVLNKKAYRQELEEDTRKSRGMKGFEMQLKLEDALATEEGVQASILMTIRADGEVLQKPKRQVWRMKRDPGSWKVSGITRH